VVQRTKADCLRNALHSIFSAFERAALIKLLLRGFELNSTGSDCKDKKGATCPPCLIWGIAAFWSEKSFNYKIWKNIHHCIYCFALHQSAVKAKVIYGNWH
jgi:hypothetical protein